MSARTAIADRGVAKAFGDRTDGVSRGVFARGNAGLASGDDPAAVLENRRRFAARFGVGLERLCTLRQIHGAQVREIVAPEAGVHEGDALVTRTPGLVLAVTTADCVPVLFADRRAGVVAAAHAGWRGAVAGVVAATVERMVALGARPEDIVATLGPAIRQSSYEVDLPFRTAVLEVHPDAAKLFAPGCRTDRWQFDLPGLVAARLRSAGVSRIIDMALDTLENGATYFSHRRSRQQNEVGYGVQLSGLALFV